MDNELEVIHHQMEEKRQSLAEKLDTLENRVLGTVHDAQEAVAHTVEDVKSVVGTVTDSIAETVENVKEAFNLSEHVRHHPWGMLGGAAAAGFLGGWMMGPSKEEAKPAAAFTPRYEPPQPAAEKASESSSGVSSLLAPLESLKGIALGALMGLVRDVVTNALPESVKTDVVKVVDDFTVKLGGKAYHNAEEEQAAEEPAAPAVGNGKHAPAETVASAASSAGAGNEPAGRKRGGSRFR